MRIISFIEDEEVISKILKYLDLWELKVKLPSKMKVPSITIPIDDSDSQVPTFCPPFYPDPIYPTDYNRISKPRWVPPVVAISAINLLFSDRPKCLDLIFIYLLALVISTGNLRLLKYASIVDK
jgi:hypothetical protein